MPQSQENLVHASSHDPTTQKTAIHPHHGKLAAGKDFFLVVTGVQENRQMIGVRVQIINMATIPQASQEIDDSPGSVGRGKMVR